MERTSNKSCMHNLELQSLRYWYKRVPSKNNSFQYNNLTQIVHDRIYKDDIDFDIQQPTKLRTNFHDRIVLRNVFQHWKKYVIHKLHTRRDVYKANYFYYAKLKKKVLNALSKNVLFKWKYIVSSTYNCTSKSTISKTNYTKAETHHNKVLLKQYFSRWREFIAIRFNETMLLEKAIAFYNLCCLRKCIICWRMYLQHRQEKKLMEDKSDKANKFYENMILKKCITAWWSFSEFAFIRLDNADLHYRNKLIKNSFAMWKMHHALKIQKFIVNERGVKESIANKIIQEKVDIFYNAKCQQRAFYAWQNWYREKVKRAIKVCEIKMIFDNRIRRITFDNWCLYAYEKKCKRRKIFLSENFHKRKLITKSIKNLYNYTVYRKEKLVTLSYINDRRTIIINHLQSIYIDKWRKALYVVTRENQKLSQAVAFWKLNLYRKYFFYWRKFSQMHKTKQFHKKELNELATNFLLKRYVLYWRDRLQDVLETNRKEDFVKSIINRKMLERHLSKWKTYVSRKRAKRQNIEAAKEVYKKFLLREGLKEILKSTLRNIDQRHCLQLEHAATRCFNNFEILKEHFDKWQSLIYLKNNLKSLHRVTNNEDFKFTHAETSCDVYNSIKNVGLVLPEYMKKKDTNSAVTNVMQYLENWAFNSQ
ncbi:uncharacterized protein LOC144478309 [Augochlora pura]